MFELYLTFICVGVFHVIFLCWLFEYNAGTVLSVVTLQVLQKVWLAHHHAALLRLHLHSLGKF